MTLREYILSGKIETGDCIGLDDKSHVIVGTHTLNTIDTLSNDKLEQEIIFIDNNLDTL